VTFSGAVDAALADETSNYRLATAGKKGSYTAKNASIIKLRSAVYAGSSDTVTLTPKSTFTLTKPVQLVVYGTPPLGLQDTDGRYIDGDDNGQSGGNAVAILAKKGVTINAVELARTNARTAVRAKGPEFAIVAVSTETIGGPLDLLRSVARKARPFVPPWRTII